MSKKSKEVGGLAKTHVLQGVEAKPTEIWGATITSEVISSWLFWSMSGLSSKVKSNYCISKLLPLRRKHNTWWVSLDSGGSILHN